MAAPRGWAKAARSAAVPTRNKQDAGARALRALTPPYETRIPHLIPQIRAAHGFVVADVARRALDHEAPGLDQIGVVGKIERERGVLLDQQDAHVLLAVERAQDAEQ